MIYKVFSVYDSKVGAYMLPRFVRSKGEIIRQLEHTVNTPSDGNGINSNPEDYTLFEIGEYDDESGAMLPVSPVSVGVAIEFLKDA